jgi:prepilin-type processing-associated H-X9-DG protein
MVELLVVVAILAVLAAFLFPAFVATRERARVVVCQSNLKQLGAAIHLYIGDWDETYPLPYSDGNPSSGTTFRPPTWKARVLPYVKSTGVYGCPSNDAMERLFAKYPVSDLEYEKRFSISYTMNALLFDAVKIEGGVYGGGPESPSGPGGILAEGGVYWDILQAGDIKIPDKDILLVETQTPMPVMYPTFLMAPRDSLHPEKYEDITREDLPPQGNEVFVHYPSDGRTNWLFCDGHVKLLRVVQTIKPEPLWFPAPSTMWDESKRNNIVDQIFRTLPPEWR